MPQFEEKDFSSTINIPPSSSYLNIDTRDQLKYDSEGFINSNGQNPFDIRIYSQDTVFQGRIIRIALTNFNMGWSAPNVNPYNDLLVIEREPTTGNIERINLQLGAGIGSQVSIDYGFYGPLDLASAVQKALNAYDNNEGVFGLTTWTCIYQELQGRFIIRNGKSDLDNNYLFRINPMLGQSLGKITLSSTGETFNRTSTLASVMGFINTSKKFSNAVIGDTASMQYTRYIDVVSQDLTAYQYTRDFSTSSNTGRNLIARIFLGNNMAPNTTQTYLAGQDQENLTNIYNNVGNSPFQINYEPKLPKYMKWDPLTYLSGFSIQIKDEFGNLLYDQLPSTNVVDVPFPVGPAPITVPTTYAGSSSYCQMTFVVSEGTN
jgi:hypothetical protein